MKICLLVIGKTDTDFIKKGIADYEARLKHYIPYEMKVIPDIKNAKNMNESQQKEREGEQILAQLDSSDFVTLLDEHGKEYTSKDFAKTIELRALGGTKRLVFVIGGPYGFSPLVYGRANTMLSLSRMTFSHQLVRLVFAEQLYRAMTILKGEPYHHE